MLTTKASIRIQGGLDPDEISRMLAMVPTYTHRAGEPDRFGEALRSNMWLLKSDLGNDKPLEQHVQSLFDKLRDQMPAIEELRTGCKLDVFCSVTTKGQGGFSLPTSVLRNLSELGFNLEVSIVASDGDD
ncbi:MAG: DUF4279 domain-containing protein [Acidobacteria bacterium]|nr:DUF4279 domain-containing protein [Acidobacteriota bacterium]